VGVGVGGGGGGGWGVEGALIHSETTSFGFQRHRLAMKVFVPTVSNLFSLPVDYYCPSFSS